MAKGSMTSAMSDQNSPACQHAVVVFYSVYPFIRWSCFMDANAPGDAAQAAAQPTIGTVKRRFRAVGEKWWFYSLTQP